jgi:hypothetical protein
LQAQHPLRHSQQPRSVFMIAVVMYTAGVQCLSGCQATQPAQQATTAANPASPNTALPSTFHLSLKLIQP